MFLQQSISRGKNMLRKQFLDHWTPLTYPHTLNELKIECDHYANPSLPPRGVLRASSASPQICVNSGRSKKIQWPVRQVYGSSQPGLWIQSARSMDPMVLFPSFFKLFWNFLRSNCPGNAWFLVPPAPPRPSNRENRHHRNLLLKQSSYIAFAQCEKE